MPAPDATMRLALITMLLALPFFAQGQDCGDDSAARITRAYQQRDSQALPERTGWAIDASRGACRVWPADTRLTLIAVPLLGPEEANGDVQAGDLDVLVVDSNTLQPRAALRLPDAVSSDAIRVDGIYLDTARYRLGADTRAFGVRVTRSGSSRANPFGEEQLQLFVHDGSRLLAITDPIVMQSNGGEWDTNCAGEFQQRSRTLEVGPPPAQGWATLYLRERGDYTEQHEDAGGNCSETRTSLPAKRYTLTPQGQHYPLPDAVKAAF